MQAHQVVAPPTSGCMLGWLPIALVINTSATKRSASSTERDTVVGPRLAQQVKSNINVVPYILNSDIKVEYNSGIINIIKLSE